MSIKESLDDIVKNELQSLNSTHEDFRKQEMDIFNEQLKLQR